MVTRLYFLSDQTPTNSPAFDAGWDRTTEAVRRKMDTPRISSSMTSFTIWSNGAGVSNESALCCQFASRYLIAGQQLSTSHTVKVQIRCREQSTNDNISDYMALKVYNGTTLKATLIAIGQRGSGSEFTAAGTNILNHTFANGDALGINYTMVAGDYLVLEVGGKNGVLADSNHLGTLSLGSNNASDLPEDEAELTAMNPWFEISANLVFTDQLSNDSSVVVCDDLKFVIAS